MEPFRKHTGVVVPLDRANVDTDQIIPKQFLKRIERTGFGEFLFFDWRYLADGRDDPQFVLNEPRYRKATILLTRRNFGSGSSREHAVWALADYGFRVVIAPSFADIFYNNSFKNGLLPVRLEESDVDELFVKTTSETPFALTVDLENCTVQDASGWVRPFELAPYFRTMLLNGWDEIALTLQHDSAIAAYETAHRSPSQQ